MERAILLINDMFSVHVLCPFVTLDVSHLGFEGGTVVLIAPVLSHCCTFTFRYFLENITKLIIMQLKLKHQNPNPAFKPKTGNN